MIHLLYMFIHLYLLTSLVSSLESSYPCGHLSRSPAKPASCGELFLRSWITPMTHCFSIHSYVTAIYGWCYYLLVLHFRHRVPPGTTTAAGTSGGGPDRGGSWLALRHQQQWVGNHLFSFPQDLFPHFFAFTSHLSCLYLNFKYSEDRGYRWKLILQYKVLLFSLKAVPSV